MIHVIRMIEHRCGLCPGQWRISARAALLSAMLLVFGLGTLLAGRVQAQGAASPTEQAFDPVREAQAILDQMNAGEFAAVHARFDSRMAAAVPAEQLGQLWTSLHAQLGPAQNRGDARVARQGDVQIVTIPLTYEKATLEAMFAFAADGRVAGFTVKPIQNLTPIAAVPADAKYREVELQVGDEATALPATLAIPKGKGPFPAVVLVHGSGPHDRDQTIGPNRPFLDIARGLAERGVATLRYEKRTKARPQDYVGGVTIDSETTDDALLAVTALRKQAGIDQKRVFVLGHSQGGMMAPRIGRRDSSIAGLILLAAPARSLLDILIEQHRRFAVLDDGKTSPEEHAVIDKLVRSVAAVRKGGDVPAAQAPLGQSAAYWRSAEAVDPVADARQVKQPMLILQGARDIQVVDADWQSWKAGLHTESRVTFKLYPTLNHLAIAGEGDGNLAEYQKPGRVDEGLIADVAAWIAAQGKKTPGKRQR